MKTEYKHIHFDDISYSYPTRKTKSFACRSNNTDTPLGDIQWERAWRQYCFFPVHLTVFSKGCLNDIADFIKQLMDERKKKG